MGGTSSRAPSDLEWKAGEFVWSGPGLLDRARIETTIEQALTRHPGIVLSEVHQESGRLVAFFRLPVQVAIDAWEDSDPCDHSALTDGRHEPYRGMIEFAQNPSGILIRESIDAYDNWDCGYALFPVAEEVARQLELTAESRPVAATEGHSHLH